MALGNSKLAMIVLFMATEAVVFACAGILPEGDLKPEIEAARKAMAGLVDQINNAVSQRLDQLRNAILMIIVVFFILKFLQVYAVSRRKPDTVARRSD